MPATGQRVDPYRNFNFAVEIDGITRARFQECTGGLSSTIDVTEYREGGYAEHGNTVHKLPGLTKYSNITLNGALQTIKNFMTGIAWYQQAMCNARTDQSYFTTRPVTKKFVGISSTAGDEVDRAGFQC